MQKEKNYMKKKILICGADGYLGWPTAMYLSEKGYQVTGPEGYVLHRNGDMIKFVNRLEFSYINFTLAKQWR